MRPIDADRLYLHLNDWAYAEAPDERHTGTERKIKEAIYETIQGCMQAVEDQPTISITITTQEEYGR